MSASAGEAMAARGSWWRANPERGIGVNRLAPSIIRTPLIDDRGT